MSYLIGFLIIITVSVAVHEFFHFYPAKKLGIKVLTYSIGMGPAIFKWTSKGKDKITYQISAFPIGGYVKMLEKRALTDEQKAQYSEEDLSRAFDVQPVWKKLIVVLGGPLSNILLALFIYMFIAMHGVSYIKPIVGGLEESGWATHQPLEVGDEILSINGNNVTNFNEFAMELLNNLGKERVPAIIKRDEFEKSVSFDVSDFEVKRDMDFFKELGIVQIQETVEPIISDFSKDSPAQESGLLSGDKIVAIDDVNVQFWKDVVNEIQVKPNQKITITYLREGVEGVVSLKTKSSISEGKEIGLVGITVTSQSLDRKYIGVEKHGLIDGFTWGYDKVTGMVNHSLSTIKLLVTGRVSVDNLSGPVGIAKLSGEAFDNGLLSFLSLMALINVSLGVLNLLPIPVLDGGHVVIYTIEGVLGLFGKKLHEGSVNVVQNIGGLLLMGFMAYVIFNDILFIF
jgi:regulator of sigma E protease